MQSDEKCFGGDVVLNSINMAVSYENSILDQIYEKANIYSIKEQMYEKQIFFKFIMKILN